MTYYSQYGQDKMVDGLLNKKNGIFVEFGANDGIAFSNSYFFEKERNWTGVCIEPIPASFQKLRQNRKCISIEGCISTTTEPKKFLEVKGYGEMLSGIVDQYDEEHLETVNKIVKEHGGSYQEISVKCFLLNDILEENGIYKIDFCSIDTEGGELSILQSLDFKKFDFTIFAVENNTGSNVIRDFMVSKNYVFITTLTTDEIYIAGKEFKFNQKFFFVKYKLKKILFRYKLIIRKFLKMR